MIPRDDIIDRLAVQWTGMGEMANAERLEARTEIVRLREELDRCRRMMPERISRILYDGEG